jgi:hypothetical protein
MGELFRTALTDPNGSGAGGKSPAFTPSQIECVSGCSRETLLGGLSKEKNGGFSYHYHLERKPDGALKLSLENWSRGDDTEFTEFRWSVDHTGKSGEGDPDCAPDSGSGPHTVQQEDCLKNLVTRSAAYLKNQETIKTEVMRRGISASKLVETTEEGEFRRKDTGEALSADQAYKVYSNESPKQKHYLRAALEIVGFLGASSAIYWSNIDEFGTDTDFKMNGDNLKDRFITGDAHRMDRDFWRFNVGHVSAGAGFYLLARSNELNILESMLYTITASSLWEFLVEFREVVSINDGIMTPIAGFAIGEAMHQMGEFFQHSSPSVANQILGVVFGPSAAFHRWLDNNRPKAPRNVDKFGFSTDVWHRFRLYVGYAGSKSQGEGDYRNEAEIGLNMELVTAEKYGKPGEACTFYADGVFNELSANAAFHDGTVVDFDFLAKVAFLGHYRQNISKDKDSGRLDGYSFFLGASSAFEYYTHEFADAGFEDKLAVVDLIGPAMVWDFYRQGFHSRIVMDAYPTFSMVQPFSFEAFKRDNKLKGAKTVFRRESYYYALGVATGAKLEADYKPFEIDAQIRYHFFDSIEGLDRYQDTQVTDDFNLQDKRLSLKAGVGYALPWSNLKVVFDVEKVFRWNKIKGFSDDEDEIRFLGKLVFEL